MQVLVKERQIQVEVCVLADDIQRFLGTAAHQVTDIHGKLEIQCVFHRVLPGGKRSHLHQPQLCLAGDQTLVQFKGQSAAVLGVEDHHLIPL